MTAAGRPRVGLWGAGVMAGAHAASCQALGWKIAGVASRRLATAETLATAVGAPAMSYDALLASDGVDLVIVSTPPADHLPAARAWTARGIPTVVSTPLCQTLDDADELVALEARSGPPLLFASNLATAPAVQAMFARAADLGRPTTLAGRSYRGAPTWGAFTTGGWGGGVLLHPAVHHLTLMLLLARVADAGRPTAVAARLVPNAHDVDEHADVELSFASGLRARIAVGWTGADRIWDLQLASTDAVLRLDMDPTPVLEHNGEPVAIAPARSTPARFRELADVGLIAQLRSFWHDIEHRRTPVMNMAFGREVLDIVCAASASAKRSGQDVALPFSGPRDRTPLALWREPGGSA
ncbi:MAG: Gfo/Idh/MocA family oxidoreductase [Ilumatobacter sp.]|nr:Gfo/Idh/MocA family oxidoreductase [Ilumatobacter sp.]